MNSERFDAISRDHGRGSRRLVLRLVGGTALGAAWPRLGGRVEASAKCGKNGKKCRRVGGKCRPLGAACGARNGQGNGKNTERKCCFLTSCLDGICQYGELEVF